MLLYLFIITFTPRGGILSSLHLQLAEWPDADADGDVAGGDGGYEPIEYLVVPDVDLGPSLKRVR